MSSDPPIGIVAYGSYVPYWRLDRQAIGAALGAGGGKGARSVASYDEDSTTMAVEAGRVALAAAPGGDRPAAVYFATTAPAYLEKTNATAVHAALSLPAGVAAYDFANAVRSGAGAVQAGLDAAAAGRSALVLTADVRTGLPGGADETGGGDGAAALWIGSGEAVIAEAIGAASTSEEILDRYRLPGARTAQVWEERFGEHALVPLAESAVTEAFKQAGITAEAVDHLLVTGTHSRAAGRVAKSLGVKTEALAADTVSPAIGNTGTAQAGLALAGVLDRAQPGQVIVTVTVADGADVTIWRTTPALTGYAGRRTVTVAEQIAAGLGRLAYNQFLTWRGFLDREPPRRPDPDRPAAPIAFRREAWKFGFTGSRCTACGTRHLPPARVCLRCRATDQMVPERMADVPGTVATYTVDRLSYSPSPPVLAAVIDFDGGGRLQCELTDADPSTLAVGDRVEMTFRKLFTTAGIHNYFWKAKPLPKPAPQEETN
ncbi:MAG TPA: OB-fold domain-containing protein [Acidimicrobiia bacterium]|nr:OB-fold domain-containing protein [Acidimicrobiia bacterium]